MRKIKIFVTHIPNKEDTSINNELIVNVVAGADYQTKPLPDGWVPDNTGDHISKKNKSYCELTTQYWAWKNVEADYYGFFHYRRYLSFNPSQLKVDQWGSVIFEYMDDRSMEKLHINESEMETLISKYDIIMAKGINVHQLGSKNVSEHYKSAPDLNYKDYQSMLSIIKERYSFLYESALEYTNGNLFYPCNMFIMKKEIFLDYSEILFGILKELENKLDMSLYTTEGYRTPGHLGERLAGIYYTYLISQKQYKIKELQVAVFLNTIPIKRLHPSSNTKKVIPLVLTVNDYYTPYLSVCIQSILDHSSEQYQYDIVIFNQDISQKNQNIIKAQFQSYDNVRISYVNVGAYLSEYKLKANAHLVIETFYRFLILDIMREYSKVIYLDCDLIICDDVALLYHTDLGKNYIGACLDPDFIGQINMPQSVVKKYATDVMKLDNPYLYFQAGVLIFNVEAMNRNISVRQLLDMAATGIYKYCDQDILNIVCAGKVKYLDMTWNVLTDCNGERIKKVIKYAPMEIQNMYLKARTEPKIIHYAGFLKPWDNPYEDFSQHFWSAARRTPFYEIIITRTCTRIVGIQLYNNKIHFFQRIKNWIYKISVKLLPYQSKRRERVKTIFKL